MKKLFPLIDNTAHKISYYHLILLLLSLPYDRFYTHIILISLSMHTLINLKKEQFKFGFKGSYLLLPSVFLVSLISASYSPDKGQALNELGQQITILLVSLLFYFNTLDFRKYRDNALLIFAVGCTGAIIYLYLQVFLTLDYYHLPLIAIFSPAFTNHNFSAPIAIHATYLAIIVAIAFVFLVSVAIEETASKYLILLILCCGVLLAGIIQLGSKAVFIALFLIVGFGIPYFLLRKVMWLKFLLVVIPISLSLMLGIYKIDTFKKRYITDLKVDLSQESKNKLSDPRLARWEVALKLGFQSPIIGHGAGTETRLLKDRFYENKFYRSYLAKLNAHNQYLSFFIQSGILGLLAYLLTLFLGFKLSWQRNDFLLFALMILVALVSFSENILAVDKGITFYSLFFSLFYVTDKKSTNK
ncbi:MAG: O-antigen ligase family protein [Bacteroidota bacterium]